MEDKSLQELDMEFEGNAPTAITVTICITILFVLFGGTPDLMDGIIYWIKINADKL